MQEKDIVNIQLSTPYRIICIADIHGNYTAFIRLLKKVNYHVGEDYLFILGDLLERGRDEEILMIDYLYELSKKDRVVIISGNNDRRMRYIKNEECQNCLEWLQIRPKNILSQWAKTIGVNDTDITEDNFEKIIGTIKQKYGDKIDFVVNLPVVIETDDFICVHSALESREDWKETTEWNAWFGNINKPNKTGKWVISGHCPVRLFPETKTNLLPIIRQDNKTISIDGGSGCFFDAQLNALIIEKSDDGKEPTLKSEFADIYPQGIITNDIVSNYINEVYLYFHGIKQIEVIKKGDYFTKCKVISSGKTGLLKNEYISGRENKFEYWDTMANFVSVSKNEIVTVIDNSCAGYAYIRNSSGELGWIPKNVLLLKGL